MRGAGAFHPPACLIPRSRSPIRPQERTSSLLSYQASPVHAEPSCKLSLSRRGRESALELQPVQAPQGGGGQEQQLP